MSFQKATDLLRLAEMAAARYLGVSLSEIELEFGIDRRTAQRMTKALEDAFPTCATRTDEGRRKFWKLRPDDARLILAQGIRDSELTALQIAIQRLKNDGAENEVVALSGLRDRLLAAMPAPHARRVEADTEALLEAHGFASRPGPKVISAPHITAVIGEALKGPHLLSVTYAGGRDPDRERLLEPHGLLLGVRRYLVARETGGDSRMQHYRIDRITSARLEASSFSRDPDFEISRHAAKAFGSFHADEEYGEVIWKFTSAAAETARSFLFHPSQDVTEEDDGSLTVRFLASGYLEMAWHLYMWGDGVQVIAPDALRKIVEGHQRADFKALP